ncbi:SDR family NAD(P)-dependent oxidoreductase [Pseudomonas sp. FME51]|uniref:SDR family NAD(P)-dependent oxidoreductase n=1 Tax=Pseudomonas sp. FME51 TaxID=2742609 RepID=UPI00299F8653|nr:SDR family NAD(P)-dependent oxidoreductase [Pseudomonas sp. FME51]
MVGASSGFGRGSALKLGELGVNVVLAARREAALNGLVAQIETAGGCAMASPWHIKRPMPRQRLLCSA